MKRMINLGVNINEDEKVIISSLSVLSDRFIIGFKSNAFEITVFDKKKFEIEMKLNR